MKPSQRLAELRYRIGGRQHGTHVSQCLSDADAAQPRAVERGDGGRAALGLDAVDQHGPPIAAQLFDRSHGVEEHEVEILVNARLIDEADINLFGTSW